MFLETFYQVAKEFPHIKADDVIVDDLAMKLVSKPDYFDIIVLPNLQVCPWTSFFGCHDTLFLFSL